MFKLPRNSKANITNNWQLKRKKIVKLKIYMNCNNPVIMNTFCTQFHFTFPYIPEKKKFIKTIIIIYLFLSDFIVYNSVFPYSLYTSGSGFELRGILIALELGRFLFDPPHPLYRPMKSYIVKKNHIGSAASKILLYRQTDMLLL